MVAIADYIEGIYAAADAIFAGEKMQNAEQIINAVGAFSRMPRFQRGAVTATCWDISRAWRGAVDTAAYWREAGDGDLAEYAEGQAEAFYDLFRVCCRG